MQARSRRKGSRVFIVMMVVIFVCGGCQKVVDIDLADSEPRLIVDGLVCDNPGPYQINLQLSGSYFNQPELNQVSGAVVIISDNAGMTDSLKEISSGVYQTSKLKGIPGKTYKLKVLSEHKVYEASTTMGCRVEIDSLAVKKGQSLQIEFNGIREDNRSEIHCYFKDPKEKNYYRFKVYRNGILNVKNYTLYDDQYTNGQLIDLIVKRVEVGEVVRVELISIDKATYEYYRTLSNVLHSNPIFGSTPANPNTNLSNGAMGYFGAGSISSKTIDVTD
jgi:hypothetical protein